MAPHRSSGTAPAPLENSLVVAVREPDRARSARCASSATRGSSARAATCSPPPTRRARPRGRELDVAATLERARRALSTHPRPAPRRLPPSRGAGSRCLRSRSPIRWPDGEVQRLHVAVARRSRAPSSPAAATASTSSCDARREALRGGAPSGSRERYGFACTAAAAQIERARARRRALPGRPPTATVEAMRVAPPPAPRTPRPSAIDGHHEVVVDRRRPGRASRSSWHLRARAGSTTSSSSATASPTRGATQRWDNFCLVTPNWQCRLPGYPYAGDDPDGFMVRDEIVALRRAATRRASTRPCARASTVTAREPRDGDGFVRRDDAPGR